MANQKNVAVINSIVTLYERGWPQRRIARELGVDRETVGRYVRRQRDALSKPAIPTPGTDVAAGANPAILTPGASPPPDPKPAIPTLGVSGPASGCGTGRQSQCQPLAALIEPLLERGLSARRIYQDLVTEHGFAGSYQAVKRFVRRRRQVEPQRFHRLESLPGEEAQVDFGSGPPVVDSQGRRRKSWIFRIVLSYSRKAYSEAVRHQDTETFLRCLENSFRFFGGVPQTLVIDNLRAAVTRADWYEPELNPKVAEFARYYGTLILPTRPYHPQHKGKVESSVKYVKNNALKGRSFASMAELNRFLAEWETQVADQRIHGTTRQQVGHRFEQVERAALQSLPALPFPSFQEARRIVHRDSLVEVAKAYYEVPEEYIGREVWARWDARTVRVFNHRREPIAVHARLEPGQFSAPQQQSSRGRLCRVALNRGYYQRQAETLGPACAAWARQVLEQRGPLGIRLLQGLLSLAKAHAPQALNAACERALSYGTVRLADLRRLLAAPDRQQDFPLLETHPLIRDLNEYGQFLADHSQHQPQEIEP
jgi:transposase